MKPSERYKLDERNHVEIPLLEQLSGLGWEIIDLTDEKQTPADTFRDNFTEVVMSKVLCEQLININPWLEDDQVEEVARQLTASFSGTGLIENNKYVLHYYWKNTVSAKTAIQVNKAQQYGLSILIRTH
jgi:type I restriction enzyme R subunit